ncbi:hypothetical protein AVEN_9696-1 [Araneus ventricosus]|uniref:Uncharacterized protein n=1 Tax=Araneus ventricosus TaxID=182803 RepID=A0A4Y2DZC8_ARAVE|nr:hypothetical protein AVEN_9696-1 [Araneus ventricosus]
MRIQLREKEEINDDVLIDDFLSLDSEAETSETLNELDVLDSVKNKNNTAINFDEDEDDEVGNYHDAEINKPSYDEMLRHGLQFEENTPEVELNWVRLKSSLEDIHEGYFGKDLVILNHGDMMRTASDRHPRSTLVGGRLPLDRFNERHANRSALESGLKPRILLFKGPDSTVRPPWSS